MTMVPAENLSKQHHHPQGGGGGFYSYCGSSFTENFCLMSRVHGYDYHSEACLGSDLGANPMAEDESRTNSVNEAGSSSKDNNQEERDEGWLQLSIGGQATRYDHNKHDHGDPAARRGGLIELDLLPGGSSQQARPSAPIFHMPEFRAPAGPPVMHSFSTSLFFQHQHGSSSTFPQGEISWAFRPTAQNMAAAPSPSSTSSSLVPLGSYFSRQFQMQSGMDVAGPSSDVRVIDPPRRPLSGIWFILQASQDQAKEPFLPQIPKSYLRIKDGRMTVGLLMKYLVNKLRLDSESEVVKSAAIDLAKVFSVARTIILNARKSQKDNLMSMIEITCRGQQLLPLMTLQHVRDQIWSSRDAVTLLPETSTADHVMLLHYGRSA